MSKKTAKPLALGNTLRDLAVIRASDLDLSTLVPAEKNESEVEKAEHFDESVTRSYEYVKEARQVIKMENRGDADQQGSRVDTARSQLEEIEKGLEDAE